MKIYPFPVKNENRYFILTKNPFCGAIKENIFDKFIVRKDVIKCAIDELDKITFAEEDMNKLVNLGAKVIFKNGHDAVNFSKKNNIKIDFDETENEGIHAQWSKNQNKIIINKKYKNTNKISEILAISASILHELSHAKDNDSISSIQEEIDCLGMNSLAYNAFSKIYKNVFCTTPSKIIKDGVELYAHLYFSYNNKNLINRISEKYGNLSVSSPNHQKTELAQEIKDYYLKSKKTI